MTLYLVMNQTDHTGYVSDDRDRAVALAADMVAGLGVVVNVYSLDGAALIETVSPPEAQ